MFDSFEKAYQSFHDLDLSSSKESESISDDEFCENLNFIDAE